MKRPTKHSLIGKWRIIEMELWDKNFLDMMEPLTSPSTARLAASSPSAVSSAVSMPKSPRRRRVYLGR